MGSVTYVSDWEDGGYDGATGDGAPGAGVGDGGAAPQERLVSGDDADDLSQYEEVYQLVREGEGWGEAILPSLQVVRRRRAASVAKESATAEIENALEALGMAPEDARDVVVAACSWRVTKRGRALLDKRLRRTVTNNLAPLLRLLCQLGASASQIGALLVNCPELLGSSVDDDEWFRCFVTEAACAELELPRPSASVAEEMRQWAESQQIFARRGKLSERRRDLLERIGFDWGVMDEHWEAMFDEFVALRIRSGSGAAALAGDVPKALRDWAELMQRLYHAGELPDAARSRLSVLDFDWGSADHWAESEARALTSVVESREAAAWERRLLELIAYHDVTGDCAVPRQFKHFPGLGSWCVRQRYLFKAGRLPEDRVRLLGELGFSFELLKPATGGAAAE